MENIRPDKLIRLSKSCLGDAEKQAVMKVLDHEYLGMGAEVHQFEQRLTEFFGRPAVCVANCTAALHLALQACDVGHGDEVLLPSLTYISSFQAISATGAKPVACDVNQETCLLDLQDAASRITSRTKAVMPVHYTGGVGDLEALYKFAQCHNLRVIEDAAHAFGTFYMGKRIGAFGDVSCFSFDGIKNITSGEGGCIVTEDKLVLQRVRDARLLGVEKDTEKRYSGQRSWEFDATTQGWRYHMSNIMAAIGLEQLKRFPEFATKRQLLAKHYDELLINIPNIAILKRDYNNIVPHIYIVRIIGLKNRKALQERLLSKNIQTGIHYQPNHWLTMYRSQSATSLPNTDAIFPEILTLPLHPEISKSDVDYVVQTLTEEIKND